MTAREPGDSGQPKASERLDIRNDAAVERFAAEQGVTAEQVRWMAGRFGQDRSRLAAEARKLLDQT